MPNHQPLDLTVALAQPASPEHRRFQTLRTRIDGARTRLQTWHQQLPVFAQLHDRLAVPLLQQLAATRRAWAFELEALQGAARWSKVDVATLSELICELCRAALDAGDGADNGADDELQALLNRHAEIEAEPEGQSQGQLESMKTWFESVAGLDLGEGPVESVEELIRRAQAQREEQIRVADAFEQAHPHQGRKRDHKTAAQKRLEEGDRRLAQTVREVYRRLASALHPDRADAALPAAERAARTALMQRANTAYEAGDLLALLELQLQIEQVDRSAVEGVAAEQVRHFNKVLAEQLRELEVAIDDRQQAFCASYGIPGYRRIDPARLGELLKSKTRVLAAIQARLDTERRRFQADAAQIKRVLKQWRADQRAIERSEVWF